MDYKLIDKLQDELKTAIKTAVATQSLVLFVGGGISKLCGFPLWNELSKELIRRCNNKDHKFLTASQVETINNSFSISPMKRISIADAYYEQNNAKLSDEIKNIFKKSNVYKSKEFIDNYNRIIKIIGTLNCRILTTNVDVLLHDKKLIEQNFIFNELNDSSLEFFRKNSKCLIHLHGCVRKPKSMIFTARQYAEKYKYGTTYVNNLNNLFRNNQNEPFTFVFIGYALEEFELIRSVASSNLQKGKYFILMPYLDCEEIMMHADINYFKSLNVKSIPYSIETNGFIELINLMEAILYDAEEHSLLPANLAKQARLDANNDPSKCNVFVRSKFKDDLFMCHFFDELKNSKYKEEWLKILIDDKNLNNFNYQYMKTEKFRRYFNLICESSFAITDKYKKSLLKFIGKYYKAMIKDDDFRVLLTETVFYFINILKLILETPCLLSHSISLDVLRKLLETNNGASSDAMYIIQQAFHKGRYKASDYQYLFDAIKIIFDSVANYGRRLDCYAIKYILNDDFENLLKTESTNFVDLFLNDIEKILNNEKFLESRIGSFAYVDEDKYADDGLNYLSASLKKTLAYVDNSKIISIFDRYYSSNNTFERKIAIYSIGVRFNAFYEKLLDKKFFSDRYLIGDIANILVENHVFINGKKLLMEKLRSMIKEGNFSNPWYLEESVRASLLNLIDDDKDYKGIYATNKLIFERCTKDSYSCSIPENPNIDKFNVEGANFESIYNYLVKHKDDFNNFDYDKEFSKISEYLTKNVNVILQGIDSIGKYNNFKILAYIIKPLSYKTYEGKEDEIIEFLAQILSLPLAVESNYKFLKVIFRAIYYHIYNHCNENLVTRIECYIADFIVENIKKLGANSNSIVNDVFQNEIYMYVYILLYITSFDENRIEKVLGEFTKLASLNNKILSLSLIYWSSYFYSRDSDWTKKNLQKIYLAYTEESFIIMCYRKNLTYLPFYQWISNTEFFKNFISTPEDKLTDLGKKALTSISNDIMYNYLLRQQDLELIFCIKYSEAFAHAFYCCKEAIDTSNVKEKAIAINETIAFYKEFNSRETYKILGDSNKSVIRQSKDIILNKKVNNNEIWKAIENSSSFGFDDFDEDDIDLLLNNFDKHKSYSIAIFLNVINNSDDNIFYFNKENITKAYNLLLDKNGPCEELTTCYKFLIGKTDKYFIDNLKKPV